MVSDQNLCNESGLTQNDSANSWTDGGDSRKTAVSERIWLIQFLTSLTRHTLRELSQSPTRVTPVNWMAHSHHGVHKMKQLRRCSCINILILPYGLGIVLVIDHWLTFMEDICRGRRLYTPSGFSGHFCLCFFFLYPHRCQSTWFVIILLNHPRCSIDCVQYTFL